MNYNLIQQLANQLSSNPLEEERICQLRPIEGLMDYYKQPFLGFSDPRNQKEYVVKWKDEKDRIKQLKKINKLIKEYNIEAKQNKKEFNKLIPPDGKVYSASELGFQKPTISIKEHPLWAFRCILTLAEDKQSKLRLLKSNSNNYIDDERLYNLYLEMDKTDFVEYINKEIFYHIQGEVRKAKDLDAWDSDNMWYEPNKRFVKWFQIKSIDPHSRVLKKEHTNNALWAIADDMRARKEDGEFDTYRDAYLWAEKNMRKKGTHITAIKLEKAYHKAKSEGKVGINKVSIPIMITNQMRIALSMLGYTKDEMKHLTPKECWKIINKGVPKKPSRERGRNQ